MGMGYPAWLLALVLVGCAAPAATPAPAMPTAGEGSTLVLLVNRSGREIRIRGRADGQTLFDETLPAQPEPDAAPARPAPSPLPTRELKVVLPAGARVLEVEEPDAQRVARIEIPLADAPRLGFRVVADRDGLAVTRDYYPRR
jgi:hypothetical protein